MRTENNYIEKIKYSEIEIQKRIKKLAKQINEDYKKENKEVVFIPILKGGLNFAYDLIKHLTFDLSIDFIKAKSYSRFGKIQSPEISYNQTIDIEQKHIVLVDDIVDTGETLLEIFNYLKKYNPLSIKIASIIIKPHNAKTKHIEKYFLWNENPSGFLMGYGLDFEEKYRNLPYIATMTMLDNNEKNK